MKKVLIIDDSALMRRVLSDIISKTNKYSVSYTACNGLEGLDFIAKNHDLDVIICDLNMPKMTGLEFLRALHEKHIDIPVVIFSSSDDSKDTITALELGAIEFIKKPSGHKDDDFFEDRIYKALAMAVSLKEKRVRHTADRERVFANEKKQRITAANQKPTLDVKTGNKLVAIVCSTGGPKALQSVIPKLPANIDAPIVLVQHMPAGFTASLAARLNDLSHITVKEAEEGDTLQKGTCYLAKGGKHLTVVPSGKNHKIVFDDSAPVGGLKPFGNIMYYSLCDTVYDEIICVVLTGMGADGTKGIAKLSETKKIYVIAQDEESSTVYGMPRAIYEKGLTDYVCDLNEIADTITKKVGVR
ncbi:MAG: chemotaxis-specific protein-glutamate methyltransferase CheB [Clostridium sp.]|nr:chemotaxis-specific protein-glutamate methyltransferase CheB [Clostridium sp.]